MIGPLRKNECGERLVRDFTNKRLGLCRSLDKRWLDVMFLGVLMIFKLLSQNIISFCAPDVTFF